MKARILVSVAFGGLWVLSGLATPVSITDLATPYFQDFNTLAVSGTNNSYLPPGWAIWEFGSNADQKYRAGSGTSNVGDTYSFGAAGETDRALGTLQSANLWSRFGAHFRNDTDHVITAITISYWGEQWRVGTTGRIDKLTFLYSLDATSLTDGSWAFVPELDFVGPDTGSPVGARDGNNPAFRRWITHTIHHLEILPGQEWWIQWRDFDAFWADDGLAVDDFTMSFQGYRIPRAVPDFGSTAGLLLVGLWVCRRWQRFADPRTCVRP
jgi:hypothetical protein